MDRKIAAAPVTAMFISAGFIAVGINTMFRWEPGDWHFIISVPSTLVFILIFVVSAKRAINPVKSPKRPIIDAPAAAENKNV